MLEPDMVLIGESDRARGRRARAALRGRLRERSAVPADEPRQRGADEDRGQHLRDDEDLVREHARRHVRAASGRGRRGRHGRARARHPDRAQVPARRDRLRRPVLPARQQGVRRARPRPRSRRRSSPRRPTRSTTPRRIGSPASSSRGSRPATASGSSGSPTSPTPASIEESPGVALARLLGERRLRGATCTTRSPPRRRVQALGGLAQGAASAAELLERSPTWS